MLSSVRRHSLIQGWVEVTYYLLTELVFKYFIYTDTEEL